MKIRYQSSIILLLAYLIPNISLPMVHPLQTNTVTPGSIDEEINQLIRDIINEKKDIGAISNYVDQNASFIKTASPDNGLNKTYKTALIDEARGIHYRCGHVESSGAICNFASVYFSQVRQHHQSYHGCSGKNIPAICHKRHLVYMELRYRLRKKAPKRQKPAQNQQLNKTSCASLATFQEHDLILETIAVDNESLHLNTTLNRHSCFFDDIINHQDIPTI